MFVFLQEILEIGLPLDFVKKKNTETFFIGRGK